VNHDIKVILFLFFLSPLPVRTAYAQPWNFVKEEQGIKVYNRDVYNSSLKSYKGEVIIHAPLDKVSAMVGNAKNFDWWGDDFKNIKVLGYENKKYVRYYYVYDMPWPFNDRDLVVEAIIKTDTITGRYTVLSRPLLNVVPEKPDLVRIHNYWQTWTMEPLEKGNVKIVLEGFVDPGGNVPSWLYNMLSSEMPFRTMNLLRQRVLSPKPANK